MTFVVHLDGMREIHDYICDYPGLWDVARRRDPEGARSRLPRHDEHDDLQGDVGRRRARDDGLPDERGRHRRNADRARLPVLPDRSRADDDARASTRRSSGSSARSRGSGTTDGSRRRSTRSSSPGERKLTCAPWGSITRNPYGWKGPCYLLTDGIFPTYDALLDGMEWEDYGPGNDPRCEHCAIHSGFEPSAAYEAAEVLCGRRRGAWLGR